MYSRYIERILKSQTQPELILIYDIVDILPIRVSENCTKNSKVIKKSLPLTHTALSALEKVTTTRKI